MSAGTSHIRAKATTISQPLYGTTNALVTKKELDPEKHENRFQEFLWTIIFTTYPKFKYQVILSISTQSQGQYCVASV